MGKETEIKLHISSAEQLDAVLAQAKALARSAAPEQLLHMRTDYYDTPDRSLRSRRQMLRVREENGVQIVTLKTPPEDGSHTRGEWALTRTGSAGAPTADELAGLAAQGAPRTSAAMPLIRVCGAAFLIEK